ncbi:hypothetical protein COL5a_003091 [Colletotrichum fioriniae]|uniref:uncharacterized protein n=1 Tax=Colletotrichum fioriniae TaxID=710243 RepID=UPI0022FFF273|nr:uncharacterized protein COL516b_010770 [Colletotrichum fioriniae]KAJ0297353.1 hypothetical protein COL516b_010770 [Colletotrichum fioriniae]KAJ0330787.1 hypothetical protein COL5a_003091 [Colletotrichum fioriniae]KAJ3945243.1 hypothetical protein N0V96_005269 [Colletotrichum fioriniae]
MSSSQQPPRPLSHFSPVPVSAVSALYDNDNKILYLKAQGNALNITTDIQIVRLQQLGGLLFQVVGWVGPISEGTRPYTVSNTFPIDLPSRVFPSGSVVIKGADNKQLTVKIEPLLKDGGSNAKLQTSSNAQADFEIPNVKLIPPTEPIITKLGQGFTVRQNDQFKGQGGSVDVFFHPAFVKLTNASIVENQIEWTFNTLQTGNTQIIVSVSQQNPPFSYRVVRNVIVKPAASTEALKPLALFSVNDASKATQDNTEAEISKSGNKDSSNFVIPSWDAAVNIGLQTIQKQFPDAKLQTATGRSPTGAGVEQPYELSLVTVTARLGNNKTATVSTDGVLSFGPVHTGNALLGVDTINWPVKVNSNDVFSIARKAGFQEPVNNIALSKPIGPTLEQPLYTLTLGDLSVQIGATDGKILSEIRS